jgi:hypothetical protein
MKKATLTVFLLALTLALAGSATAATVVDFDSFNVSGGLDYMPDGYAGFTWTSFAAVDSNYYNTTFSNHVFFLSSPNAASNLVGSAQASISHSLFNLVGADFSYWAFQDGPYSNSVYGAYSATGLTVAGYNGVNLVKSVTFSLTNDFVYEDLGLNNIDNVTFTVTNGHPGLGDYWLMDNMAYTPVPLPAAFWLLGSGLAGLAGWRRFRKT